MSEDDGGAVDPVMKLMWVNFPPRKRLSDDPGSYWAEYGGYMTVEYPEGSDLNWILNRMFGSSSEYYTTSVKPTRETAPLGELARITVADDSDDEEYWLVVLKKRDINALLQRAMSEMDAAWVRKLVRIENNRASQEWVS